jgi:hypothetical protein
LTERGPKALGSNFDKEKGRPEPDVLIELNGVRIVIEGKKPGMWKALVDQCKERLDSNVCDLCVIVEYTDVKLKKLVPDQLDVKDALLKGRCNIGLFSHIDRAGLDMWLPVAPKPEEYADVGFDEFLTYLMSTYTRVVSEDIMGPVINRMNEVLGEFVSKVITASARLAKKSFRMFGGQLR